MIENSLPFILIHFKKNNKNPKIQKKRIFKKKDTSIDITKEKINSMIDKDKSRRNLRRKEGTEKYRN